MRQATETNAQFKEIKQIKQIKQKVINGERLSNEDALYLFRFTGNLPALGRLATIARNKIDNNDIVTYIVDRNINYTNVCVAYCKFCAFYREPKNPEGYVLSREQLRQKIEELKEHGGIQILLQGGHNPYYKLDWYEETLSWIRSEFDIHIHGFSPPEIIHFSRLNKLSIKEVLERLKKAGLGSLPGGGAEILTNRARKELARNRADADEWLEVMRQWHKLGGKSSSTMVIGHIESIEERVEHLDKIRSLQDETGGFTAFIVWTMQNENTDLAGIRTLGSYEYLKAQAIARIYLDNIPNIQASWVTQGIPIGQVSLYYGANDMGSTMLEENVVSAAGTTYRTSEEEIRRVIAEAGFIPRRRNFFYEIIEDVKC